MQKPVGIVLAGGQARRMGLDKAGDDKGLLMLGDISLMGRVIERLCGQVHTLALNANGDAARFDDFSLPCYC